MWEFGYQHFPNITKDGTLILSTHMPGYRTTNMPVAGQHAYEEYTIDRTARKGQDASDHAPVIALFA